MSRLAWNVLHHNGNFQRNDVRLEYVYREEDVWYYMNFDKLSWPTTRTKILKSMGARIVDGDINCVKLINDEADNNDVGDNNGHFLHKNINEINENHFIWMTMRKIPYQLYKRTKN